MIELLAAIILGAIGITLLPYILYMLLFAIPIVSLLAAIVAMLNGSIYWAWGFLAVAGVWFAVMDHRREPTP